MGRRSKQGKKGQPKKKEREESFDYGDSISSLFLGIQNTFATWLLVTSEKKRVFEVESCSCNVSFQNS